MEASACMVQSYSYLAAVIEIQTKTNIGAV